MIRVSGLSKQFSSSRKILFPDFQISESDSLLIHGPSGCGKTTLLNILSGLLIPDSGMVWIGDQNLFELSAAQRDHFRGKNIGVCLQHPVFLRSLNVLDNLLFSQHLATNKTNREYCLELIHQLGLQHTLHQSTNTLSQGERQRLMLIRALINKPKILLADEPTSSLDDHNTDLLTELMISQTKLHHCALIMVSHDARLKKLIDQKVFLG